MADVPSQLPSTSTSLLMQLKVHDAEAWRRLTQIYGPSVYRWCRSAGLQPADAADIVQDVFQTVAKRVEQFQQDSEGSFRGWLWAIFRSRLMDHYRERKGAAHELGESALAAAIVAAMPVNPSTASHDKGAEAARLVQRALEVIRGDFQERAWQAFWRSTVLDERTRDIAAALSMTPAAVCMARSRVLERLRETLAGMGLLDDGAGGTA